jgi:hypothetical protein
VPARQNSRFWMSATSRMVIGRRVPTELGGSVRGPPARAYDAAWRGASGLPADYAWPATSNLGEAALLIGSYERWSGLGLGDLTVDDGDRFRVGPDFPRPRGQKVHRVAPPGSLVATA